jgi:hypothetical protein
VVSKKAELPNVVRPRNAQMRQFVAHVHLPDGIMEVEVWGTTRWDASDAVYRKLNLEGPNDSKIKSFRIIEKETPAKNPEPEKTEMIPVVPASRDKSKDKRYRVRMYPTRMSRDMKSLTFRTASAEDALWSMMSMHRVPSEAVLGPYCVELETAEGRVTVKGKDLHTFPDHGRVVAEDGYDPAPQQTKAKAEDDGPDYTSTQTVDEEWEAAWATQWQNRSYGETLRETRAKEMIAKVEDILANETKIPVIKPKVETR